MNPINRNRFGMRFVALVLPLLGGGAFGCNSVLGLDDLAPGCVEGATECSATGVPRRCNAVGVMEEQPACGAGKVCGNGDCVPECDTGDLACDGNRPKSCNVVGAWEYLTECQENETCKVGRCNCNASAVRCSIGTNMPQTCGLNGEWKNDAAGPCVNQTCVEGVCIGECAPEQKNCEGQTPRACQNGAWVLADKPCDVGSTCQGGECINECIPGDKRCFDNTPQICDAAKTWQNDGAPCNPQTCVIEVVACLGECVANEKKCNGNQPQQCGPTGQWEDLGVTCMACQAGKCEDCIPGEKYCVPNTNTLQTCDANGQLNAVVCNGQTCIESGAEAACLGVCAPGKGCLDNTPQDCDANGQWVASADACEGTTCKDGVCVGTCAPGGKRCAGNTPQHCDANGMWANNGLPCGNGTHCAAGQCVEECTPGDLRCISDIPQICSIAGDWQPNGPVCATCVECNSNIAACEPTPIPKATCTDPTAIAVGYGHACAVLPSGSVKCWGANYKGQLGLGDTQDRGNEANEMGNNLPIVDLGTGVMSSAVAAGFYHTCALLTSGQVKCWGNNDSGQLGLGDTVPRGDGIGEMGNNLPIVDLGTNFTVTQIAARFHHTCAISAGTVKCWGANVAGQLGLGSGDSYVGEKNGEMGDSLLRVNLGTNAVVIKIVTGESHTCALLSTGAVKCWGANGNGQLGLGNKLTRGGDGDPMGDTLPAVDVGMAVTDIAAGATHTCAVLSNGTVKCWGSNFVGQLGLGDIDTRGDEMNEMGNNLPVVDLGTGVTGKLIAAGAWHTCALLSDDKVKCWGANDWGCLGLGEATLARGDEQDEMGMALPTVDLGTDVTVTAISAGGGHTCARLTGGHLKCWGHNDGGQLGLGDILNRGDEPNEMGDNLPRVVP